MIKNHAFSAGTFCQFLSEIYKLDNTARVKNIPAALLQIRPYVLFLQFRPLSGDFIINLQKAGLRSICIRGTW